MKSVVVKILIVLASILANSAQSQGVVRSKIIHDSIPKQCKLIIRSIDDWDNPIEHIFKVSTSTYLENGEYRLQYLLGERYLHSEWIHIPVGDILIEKFILETPISLTSIKFNKSKMMKLEKYMEF